MSRHKLKALFVCMVIILAGCTSSNTEEKVSEIAEIDKLFPKNDDGIRTIDFEIRKAECNTLGKATCFPLSCTTNLPDKTEVIISLDSVELEDNIDYESSVLEAILILRL